nr:ERAD-associated E3 ubiquitin-protein ligase [Cryptomonas paramecium]
MYQMFLEYTVFLNCLVVFIILSLLSNLFNLKKKEFTSLHFLEYFRQKNIKSTLFFFHIIFLLATFVSSLKEILTKNGIKLIPNRYREFFFIFSIDKKNFLNLYKTGLSEFLILIMFYKRKFSTFSGFFYCVFIFLKNFFTFFLRKIKNLQNTCEEFSVFLQIQSAFFLIMFLYTQTLIYDIISKTSRKRVINAIIGSEVIYSNLTVKAMITNYLFVYFSQNILIKKKWTLCETYEFYLRFLVSLAEIFCCIVMFVNVSVSKKSILRYYAIKKTFESLKEFVLNIEESIRFRKMSTSIKKKIKTPTNTDIDNLVDKTCVICRDNVEFGSCKMLSCCHIFHVKCLQSWLKRQYCCPTCLSPISSVNSNFFLCQKQTPDNFDLKKRKLNTVLPSFGYLKNRISGKISHVNSLTLIPSIKPNLIDVLFFFFHDKNNSKDICEKKLKKLALKLKTAKMYIKKTFLLL